MSAFRAGVRRPRVTVASAAVRFLTLKRLTFQAIADAVNAEVVCHRRTTDGLPWARSAASAWSGRSWCRAPTWRKLGVHIACDQGKRLVVAQVGPCAAERVGEGT